MLVSDRLYITHVVVGAHSTVTASPPTWHNLSWCSIRRLMSQNFLTSTMRHWPSCRTSTHPGSRLSSGLELQRRGTTLSAVSRRQRQGSWRRPTDGDAQLSRNMRGEYSSVSNVYSSSRSTSTLSHVPSTRVTATRKLCGQSCECCCSLSRAAVHA